MADSTDRTIDYVDFLPSPFIDNPFWQAYAKSITTVFASNIDAPRKELQNIRDTTNERTYLIKNVRMLGFEDKSSFLQTTSYSLLLRFLGQYWEQNGSPKFVNFFGYIKNSFFTIDQLWSNDYITFKEIYKININTDPITRGGEWYPTSHVNLSYDFENANVLDPSDLEQLFYIIAPIHLVLDKVIAANYGGSTFFIGVAGMPYYVDEIGRYDYPYEGDAPFTMTPTNYLETVVEVGRFDANYKTKFSDTTKFTDSTEWTDS